MIAPGASTAEHCASRADLSAYLRWPNFRVGAFMASRGQPDSPTTALLASARQYIQQQVMQSVAEQSLVNKLSDGAARRLKRIRFEKGNDESYNERWIKL